MIENPDYKINWNQYFDALDSCMPIMPEGKISRVIGLVAEGDGLGLGIGSLCIIKNNENQEIKAEVIGFRDEKVLLMPYGNIRGISPGSRIIPFAESPEAFVGNEFIGRIIDGMGMPLDGKGTIDSKIRYPLYGKPINPMHRKPIKEYIDVGINAINTMMTLGRGQRVAIMSGSGVGKSMLMGMMTKHTEADITVVGLIGERGREVKDFINDILGEDGIKKSVVIAATSDTPPLVRIRGAYLATTIAEYFRDQGKNVLLIIDSITRFAMSYRDVGLAAGEFPTSKGYTPSFFVQIPILLERAGYVEKSGSITGIYTVLVEGDDFNDPVGDTVRSIVDGHIILTRELADKGHYPAIDVLASVSRVIRSVTLPEHFKIREKAIDIIAAYKNAEDMISIGAYVDGSNPKIDQAKKLMPLINQFLKQDINKKNELQQGVKKLSEILSKV
ncbi:MAG: flagellum-specific ATP synthase FliI [Desulfobacteraceae bacterium 4572_130]|nr:MAG: flagellum-specific ATP synthase FliI [Desulfobacteraceae bacterium 4572_130]